MVNGVRAIHICHEVNAKEGKNVRNVHSMWIVSNSEFVCVCAFMPDISVANFIYIFPSHRFYFHSSLIFIIGTKNMNQQTKKWETFVRESVEKNPIIPKWYSFD